MIRASAWRGLEKEGRVCRSNCECRKQTNDRFSISAMGNALPVRDDNREGSRLT
jgi:hypothetical protein